MNQGVASADVVFRDALGERRRITDSTGHDADLLCVAGELASVPAFESALRKTIARLTEFHHPAFAALRSVERYDAQTLAVVSDAVRGVRLSRLLTSIVERGIALDLPAALHLTRQLITALDALHAFDRDIAHGALGPERVVINAQARAIVVDHVFGAALEQLRYSHQHYWKSLRVSLPRSVGITKFDHSVDVMQIGVTALALILGRVLKDDEYSAKLVDLVNTTQTPGPAGDLVPLKPALRAWLLRAMQFDQHHSFPTASDAGAMLDTITSEDERAAGAASFERVLMRHHGVTPPPLTVHVPEPAVIRPPEPAPVSMPRPHIVTPAPRMAAPPPPPPIEVPRPVSIKMQTEPPAAAPVAPPPIVRPLSAHAPAAQSHVGASHVGLPPVVPPPLASAHVPAVPAPPAPVAASPSASQTFIIQPVAARVDPVPSREPAVTPFAAAPAKPAKRAQSGRTWLHVGAAVVAIAVLTGGIAFAVHRRLSASSLTTAAGTLTVQTNPPGAQLEIDGKPSGLTPATLTLPQGSHRVVLRGPGQPRTLSVDVAAGAQLSQYIELARSAPTTGGLVVRTEPPGADVSVDHTPQGASPATITNLTPGDHSVVVSQDGVSVEQIVTVEAGVSASLVVPLVPRDRALLSGWIAVSAPIDVQIFETGKLLGTNQTDRLMVSAGEHKLEFANEALGFRVTKSIKVGPGKVETVSLKLPSGSMALNATPWAEVWLDGEKAGDTPIGNLQATIGKHEVVFRHPDLGEVRQTVTVTSLAPTRLSVDMRKK